jgi:hypothetical protein
MTFSAIDWSVSGFPETLASDSPTWDRPARVGLDGDVLAWFAEAAFVANARLNPPLAAKPAPNLLREFVGLADGSPEDVRAFAAKWGVLHLCRHRLPRSHPPMPSAPRGTLYCEDVVGDDIHGYEPVIQWLAWATVFRAVVSLVAKLRDKETGLHSDWAVLRPGSPPPTSLDDAGRLLDAEVQKILYVGLVVPIVDVARPRITIRGLGLYGMLAVQLLLLIAGTKTLPYCTACRLPYSPTRRPARGRRNYCPTCRANGEPERDASADWRRGPKGPRAKREKQAQSEKPDE